MAESVFEAIGKSVTKAIVQGKLDQHLTVGPVMARDQAMRPGARGPVYDNGEEMPVRGMERPNGNGMDQDPNGAVPSADELLGLIRQVMARMPDRAAFVEGLTELVSGEDPNAADPNTGMVNGDEVPSNNLGALDRSRGRRGAADRRSVAQDHALRAKQSASFNQKWGKLTGNIGIDMPKWR